MARRQKSKKNKTHMVSDYLDNIRPENLEFFWTPQGHWHDVHGDNKATTYGQYQMQTTLGKDNKFWVQILGSVRTGAIRVHTHGKTEPDEYDILEALETELL